MENNTLFDQLHKLQELPDAFDDWADYRNELSRYIIECCTGQSGGDTGKTENSGGKSAAAGGASDGGASDVCKDSALIIGAGACNDLDLNCLKKHFGSITLLDNDLSSVKAGIERQGLSEQDFELLDEDIVGISQDSYRNFCRIFGQILNRRLKLNDSGAAAPGAGSGGDPELENSYLKLMQTLYDNRSPLNSKWLSQYKNKFDYVICAGVHSQLNNIFCQMAQVYNRYVPFDLEGIFQLSSRMNGVLAAELNEMIFAAARKGAIVAFETSRLGVEGAVEGAYQGMVDLEKRIPNMMAPADIKRKTFLWPFNPKENKFYRVAAVSVTING